MTYPDFPFTSTDGYHYPDKESFDAHIKTLEHLDRKRLSESMCDLEMNGQPRRRKDKELSLLPRDTWHIDDRRAAITLHPPGPDEYVRMDLVRASVERELGVTIAEIRSVLGVSSFPKRLRPLRERVDIAIYRNVFQQKLFADIIGVSEHTIQQSTKRGRKLYVTRALENARGVHTLPPQARESEPD